MKRAVTYFLVCLAIFSCSSTGEHEQPKDEVVHVVLIWLKEPEHMQQIINESRRLREISELQQLRVGKSIPSDRKVVDDSFDIGLYMTFNNQEDMQRYLIHPEHKDVVNTVLKPLVSEIKVYDFKSIN